jgi:hypothetical protein
MMADISAEMPMVNAPPMPAGTPDVVVVRVTRKMARLLARLEQLEKMRARALVDMGTLKVQVLGKEEVFG